MADRPPPTGDMRSPDDAPLPRGGGHSRDGAAAPLPRRGPWPVLRDSGGHPGRLAAPESRPPLAHAGAAEAREGAAEAREGASGARGGQEGTAVSLLPQLSVEAAAIMQELDTLPVDRVRRYPSPRSCAAELSTLCRGAEGGPSVRGALAPRSAEPAQMMPTEPLFPRGSWRGRFLMNPRRGSTRMMPTRDAHGRGRTPDPEPSEELSEIQMMRVTISLKEEDSQAKSSGPPEAQAPSTPSNAPAVDSLVRIPVSRLSTTPRQFPVGNEKHGPPELQTTYYKKKQCVFWNKKVNRPRNLGAVAAATPGPRRSPPLPPIPPPPPPPPQPQPAPPVASGGATKASSSMKATKEKRPPWDASKGAVGKTFPPWGQRVKPAQAETPTLPPISGVAIFGRSTRGSVMPSRPRHSRTFVSRRSRQPPMEEADKQPTSDPGHQAQLPAPKAEQPVACAYPTEFSSGDHNPRVPQVPGIPLLVITGQRGIRPRASLPSGDQEPPGRPSLPALEENSPAPGSQACAQCQKLRKEIEELRQQLAVMRAVAEEF